MSQADPDSRDGLPIGPPFGAVVIGRNEGERLKRCLESVIRAANVVVYVDSGSSDGSVAFARGVGVTVVSLDMGRPFTAARAQCRISQAAHHCARACQHSVRRRRL
jgi:hypothetical protein